MDAPIKTTLQKLQLIVCLCVMINHNLAYGQYYPIHNENIHYSNPSDNGRQQHSQLRYANTQLYAKQPQNNDWIDNNNGYVANQAVQPRHDNTQSYVSPTNNVNQQTSQQINHHTQSYEYREPSGHIIPDQSHNNNQQTIPHQYGQNVQQMRHICRLQIWNYDCVFRDVVVENNNVEHIFGNHQEAQSKTKIAFENSRMDYLPKSLMDAFPNMEVLNAESLQIKSIDYLAFGNASRLQNVYLADNLIEQIGNNSFNGASNIVLLSMERNRINEMGQFALSSAKNLKVVYLSFNGIPNLPSFRSNKFLEIVNASHNAVTRIGDNHFVNNPKLQILDLSFNQLNYFNMRLLDSNTNLQLVDVSSNQLRRLAIPAYVITLFAQNNSIELLFIHWQRQCMVEELYLSRNQIKNQPDLSKCQRLRNLDLSHNQLESFNFIMLQDMSQLTHVNLKNNHLLQIELPTQLYYPLSIQYLELSSNKLSDVPNTNALSNLVGLYLNNNILGNFDFHNKPALRYLTLSYNQWNCAALDSVVSLNVLDRQQEYCSGFDNQGVCCQSNGEQDSQNVQKIKDLVRDNFIHKHQNKLSVDEYCRSQYSNNNQVINELKNVLATNERLEESQKPILRDIANVNQQFEQVKAEIELIKNEKRMKNNKTNALVKEIDRWRDTYGIDKEGLVDGRTVLDRIIKFLDARKTVNDNVLKRRQDEVDVKETEKQNKLDLIDATNDDIEKMKQIVKELKLKEQDAKTKRNSLAAKVNKNSPSQRG